jgi:DNA repair exonuclease SbcCD ATPase subunit
LIQEKIKVPFRKLKHIHHISDIQIRNLKRHREYEEVFNGLYEEVKNNPDNAVAYIGGDIAHSKTEMSPELIDQLSRLFKNLSDIVPTIIIAGNHDCNLNNLNRMDCLTPIVENLNHPNLHYLKRTGIYTCADTDFIVWDVWDNEKDYIKAKDVPGDRKKVVLFHGTVDRSETDLGFKLPSKVKMSMFKGYDLGLLGDIHKRQHLNKEETISYCGSLVQQNHGEDIGKGYLLWDMETLKSEYKEIHNDFGYYTIDIQDGKLPDLSDLPNKPRVRVRVSNTKPAQLKRLMTKVQKMAKIQESVITRVDGLSKEKIRDNKINIGDVNNPDYQYDLISEYLKNNYIVDDDTMIKIKDILTDLNSVIPEADIQRNVHWKLKRFEFDNMFSYGENNVVDFTKLNGIIGLFAPNATGKSALLDALSFCLFDTCSRAYKADNIINNSKSTLYCKVNFEIDGVNYFIERRGKKNLRTGHVKVDVDFWLIDDSGDKISLNGDQRRTTQVNIRKVIGGYDDFILTSMSSQNNSTVFIDKTQKERKELLSQFMGLKIFDTLYTQAADDIKEVNTLLNDFKKSDYDSELAQITNDLILLEGKKKDFKKDERGLKKEIKSVQSEIKEQTKRLKHVDDSLQSIETLETEHKKLQQLYEQVKNKLSEYEMEQFDFDRASKEIESKIEVYKKDNIEEKYYELEKLEEERDLFQVEIDKLKIEVRSKLDKIEKLGNLTYDEDCNDCMTNPFTLDAIETQKNLDKDKSLAQRYVQKKQKMEERIQKQFKVRAFKKDLDDLENKLNDKQRYQDNITSNIQLNKEKQKNITTQLNLITTNIEKSKSQEQNVIFNQQVEVEIDKLQNNSDDLDYQLDVVSDKLTTLHGDIQVLKTKENQINDNITKVEELEDSHQAYQYLLEAIKRDGVPYDLISKSLPTVEGAVNDILAQIVDFNVLFNMDGKVIDTHIVYDDDRVWPLELSSGMERFISSLAIRVGLMNVSNLPRSNFLAIDEGWGTMDNENLNSVAQLFQYLKSQFQFTFVVSHIESMRDFVDTLLEIKKVSGSSSVKFSRD